MPHPAPATPADALAQAATLHPGEHASPVGEALRFVMRRVPSPVTVVTARGADGAVGAATIGSFTSVSLDPPLVSFNVFRGTDLSAALGESDAAGPSRFAVHVLRSDQGEEGARFAHPELHATDRLAQTNATDDPDGVPSLPVSLARLSGVVQARIPAGDHLVYVGSVERVDGPFGGDPLVYLDRAFGRFQPT